ncbi:CheR family methyltransferase [Paenibacillus cymbidii]|uniref:CheR family methyltransferase n=1 Tax=Paenibacillus cymbidii TaxID=1639034 RepID=UPI001080A0E2|nr:CheR family methyltransferase [Paenibacillus cymbidii]
MAIGQVGATELDVSPDEWSELLHDILQRTRYDFRNYSIRLIKRVLSRQLRIYQFADLACLRSAVCANMETMNKLTAGFMVHVTEMFRNPATFRYIRHRIVPELGHLPFIRIWIVGCATGEEAYSFAIMLYEAGLLERSRIYATDIALDVLAEARRGCLTRSKFERFESNYRLAGGEREPGEYVERDGENGYFRAELRRRITFSVHDLTADVQFQDFDLICCRNVMIYFNEELKNKTHRLLLSSLRASGFLVLGDKETVKFSDVETHYIHLDQQAKIFRKVESKGGCGYERHPESGQGSECASG